MTTAVGAKTNRVPVTIRGIDRNLWREARATATIDGMTVADLVEEALKEIIQRRRKAPVRTGRS